MMESLFLCWALDLRVLSMLNLELIFALVLEEVTTSFFVPSLSSEVNVEKVYGSRFSFFSSVIFEDMACVLAFVSEILRELLILLRLPSVLVMSEKGALKT